MIILKRANCSYHDAIEDAIINDVIVWKRFMHYIIRLQRLIWKHTTRSIRLHIEKVGFPERLRNAIMNTCECSFINNASKEWETEDDVER
jgi:hypothetical protein